MLSTVHKPTDRPSTPYLALRVVLLVHQRGLRQALLLLQLLHHRLRLLQLIPRPLRLLPPSTRKKASAGQ